MISANNYSSTHKGLRYAQIFQGLCAPSLPMPTPLWWIAFSHAGTYSLRAPSLTRDVDSVDRARPFPWTPYVSASGQLRVTSPKPESWFCMRLIKSQREAIHSHLAFVATTVLPVRAHLTGFAMSRTRVWGTPAVWTEYAVVDGGGRGQVICGSRWTSCAA